MGIGQDIVVRKLRPDRSEVFRWSGRVLERARQSVVIVARFNGPPGIRVGDITLERGDVFVEFYYADRWYNVYQVFSTAGVFKGWYCNVSEPLERLDGAELAYVDLVLDVVVHPAGDHLVLDEDEFAELVPSLPPEVAAAAQAGLRELIEVVGRGALPWRAFEAAVAALDGASGAASRRPSTGSGTARRSAKAEREDAATRRRGEGENGPRPGVR
jgi:hypothetical protein